MIKGSSLQRRPAQHGLSPFARSGHRRAPKASRFLSLSLSLLHSRIWFTRYDALHTSQNAELFCEIRMMRRSAILIARNAMDAHYC